MAPQRRTPWLLLVGAAGRLAYARGSLVRHLGEHPFLEGNVYRVGEQWSCSDGCSPRHENESVYPSVDRVPVSDSSCSETKDIGTLQTLVDIAGWCTGLNLTCSDLENNRTLREWRKDMYAGCDQDRDLIDGYCSYQCFFNREVHYRCVHTFDKRKTYGLHGGLGLHHCLVVKWCPNGSSAELSELHCNQSADYEPAAETSEPRGRDRGRRRGRRGGWGEEIALVSGLVLLALVVACLICYVIRLRRRAQKAEAASYDNDSGSVVVGRPVIDPENAEANAAVSGGKATAVTTAATKAGDGSGGVAASGGEL